MSYQIKISIACLSLIICSCGVINFKYKTPETSSKYPIFTVKDSLKGYNSIFRSCYDVTHYDIDLAFDLEQKSIKGSVTTTLKLLQKSKTIQLDLDSQFKVDSIICNHKQLSFTRKFTAIYVDLDSDLVNQSVTVYYQGVPKVAKNAPWEGGFVWKKDKNNNPFVSVACEDDGSKTWLPIKMYLGDEPDSVTMHYTVPSNLTAISNGNLVSVKENLASKTFTWKTSYMINPYNITFYIGDYKLIETPYSCIDGEIMSLKYYVLSYNIEKAKLHFKQTEGILKTYEELFGKYPWPKDGYKLVESPFAGMEHQTAIAYGNGYKNERNENYDYIILHETAHEWWGNAVSVADFSDLWIHEGIATYAEALYIEKTKGHQAYIDYTYWSSIQVLNKKPVVGPRDVYYSNYKDGDIYNKGAVMLHTLRNHLNNDTAFFSILKTFFKMYCYKTVSTQDFILLANKISGQDLNWFFNQYLFRRESPYLKWNFEYNENTGLDVIIFQFERVSDDFSLQIAVEQGKQKFMISPKKKLLFVTLPSPASIPVSINYNNSYIQDGFKKVKLIKK
jgi:aminopeptidase N